MTALKRSLTILILSSLLLSANQAFAHPGRTASDGCHYCRTNCDYWGVPWNQRHCDGAYTPPAATSETNKFIPQEETNELDLSAFLENSAQVTEVIDGDTIRINLAGEVYRVRLIGIDTPETKDPRKPVECFGQEATEKLKSLIDNETVTLTKDTVGDTIDTYGRLLRYVTLQNVDINAHMIKVGYAYAYTKYPFDRTNEYVGYENEAQLMKRGLWAEGICGNTPAVTSPKTDQVTEAEEEYIAKTPVNETPETQSNTPSSSNSAFNFFTAGIIIASLILGGKLIVYLLNKHDRK